MWVEKHKDYLALEVAVDNSGETWNLEPDLDLPGKAGSSVLLELESFLGEELKASIYYLGIIESASFFFNLL